MASFIPQHDQPVSFQSLSLLDPSVLSEAISTLRNSLLHLESSNEQIAAFLRDSAAGEERLSEEERVEFEESVKENEWTMYVRTAQEGGDEADYDVGGQGETAGENRDDALCFERQVGDRRCQLALRPRCPSVTLHHLTKYNYHDDAENLQPSAE